MVRQQAAHDVDPPLSETASYIKNEMTKEGYRHLLAVGALFFSPQACNAFHYKVVVMFILFVLLLANWGQHPLAAQSIS